MKKVKSLAIIFMGLLCLGVFTGCKSNDDYCNTDTTEQSLYQQDFVLINKTGTEIKDLYISPSGEENWGSNVLTTDTLSSGKKANVVFSTGVKTQYWDLKAKDKNGKEIEWRNIDLFTISEITLKFEGSVPITSIK